MEIHKLSEKEFRIAVLRKVCTPEVNIDKQFNEIRQKVQEQEGKFNKR